MEYESCVLNLPSGRSVPFTHCQDLGEAIRSGCIDGMIVEGTWGFNDLGAFAGIIGKAIQMEPTQIQPYSRKVEIEKEPMVIRIDSLSLDRPFKGISLVPTENSACYEKFAVPFFGKPSRDFYYSVVFEALQQLLNLGCRKIGIAGITGSLIHCENQDLANCVAEAVAHSCLEYETLDKVVRVSNGPDLSFGIRYFNDFPDRLGKHREIDRNVAQEDRILISTLRMKPSNAA